MLVMVTSTTPRLSYRLAQVRSVRHKLRHRRQRVAQSILVSRPCSPQRGQASTPAVPPRCSQAARKSPRTALQSLAIQEAARTAQVASTLEPAAPSDTPFSATKRRTVPRLGCLPATDVRARGITDNATSRTTAPWRPSPQRARTLFLPLYAVVASAHALALSSTFVSFNQLTVTPSPQSRDCPDNQASAGGDSPEEAAAADVVAAEYYRCDKNGQIARACLDAGAGGGGGSGYGSGGGGGGEFAPSRTQRYRDL
ncbi:hypothetical protein C8F01DRAFT_1307642 [Mycena amicta]|nr:hypothetical protein C8F01DRAFT_1307642 [Mycena amicta]